MFANGAVALRLVGLMALVCGLAYFFFLPQSLRLDESQSLWQSSRSAAEILTIVAQDVHVPLYHELLHFWRMVFGNSVETARLFSFAFYVASIPAIYALGKLAYGRAIGLFAATLLALSPFMNWYGSEIRMYTLFAFLTILNQYFFIALMRKRGEPLEHWWAGYAITALMGIFVHYFFFLGLLSQALFFFVRRELFAKGSLKRFIGTAAMIAAAMAPWLWWVLRQGQASDASPILRAPTSVDVFNTFSQFVFGFQTDHLNTVALSLWPIAVLLGILAIRKTSTMLPETQYFALTFFVSVAAAFVVSITLEPVFVARYLIFTVPSLYLVLASLLYNYPPRASRIARVAVILLMIGGLATEALSAQTPVKEDYRGAARYLTERAQAQDIVILSAPFTVYPVEYYYRGSAPLSTIPRWDRYAFGPIPEFASERLPQEVEQLTQDHQYAWLLLSYDQGYEEEVRIYFDTNFERVFTTEFSPGLTLWVYKLRYDTPLADVQFDPGTIISP